jgi:hypothetical protein
MVTKTKQEGTMVSRQEPLVLLAISLYFYLPF